MSPWTRTTAFLRGFWRKFQAFSRTEAASDDFADYWSNFGHWAGIYRSPVVWTAGILALVNLPLLCEERWSTTAFALVPTVMGFSLTAMAITLAIPSTKIFEILAEEGRKDSYFMDLTSKLAHFIFLQTLTLLVAITGRAWDVLPIAFVGSWLLHYAVLTGALIGLSLYGTARMFNYSARRKDRREMLDQSSLPSTSKTTDADGSTMTDN